MKKTARENCQGTGTHPTHKRSISITPGDGPDRCNVCGDPIRSAA